MWHGALSVFRFELRRTMTVSRIAVWLMLILFPVFIVSVMKAREDDIQSEIVQPPPHYQREMRRAEVQRQRERRSTRSAPAPVDEPDTLPEQSMSPEQSMLPEQGGALTPDPSLPAERPMPNMMDRVWGFVFFGLIPEVITLFGLLLWMPALVHAELEGRTWIYLAVRPRGRVSVLLGKYLTAITWTAAAGWISTTICILVAQPGNALRLWGTMIGLVALACVAYGAVYSLIGVWLHRRAMVVAVAYTLIFEFLVSLIPAVINKFTVQYRLRNLLFAWLDWWDMLPSGATTVFLGTEPAWVHVLVLCGIVVGVLTVAVQLIQHKEYATANDS